MQRNKIIKEKKLNQEELLSEIARLKKELKKKKKYGLVWEEKKEDVVEMCKEKLPVLVEDKSKAINETGEDEPVNILIEGDNYHALSALNYTHEGKIDVIYIDPPYNTGAKDWKYNNDYVDSDDAFKHSKWLCMMEKRVKLSKKLLKKNGVLCCTIDEYEIFSLLGIFNELNSKILSIVSIVNKAEGRNQKKYFTGGIEYAVFVTWGNPVMRGLEVEEINSCDECGKKISGKEKVGNDSKTKQFEWVGFHRRNPIKDPTSSNRWYPIYISNGEISLNKTKNSIEVFPINKKGDKKIWGWKKERLAKFLDKNKNEFRAEKYELKKEIRYKILHKRYEVNKVKPKSYWIGSKYNAYSYGTKLIKEILQTTETLFEFPKSLKAVIDCIDLFLPEDGTVLDFFAGSGTTGHAALELNKRDDGSRKFILVTNNESNICETVTFPRIRNIIIGGYKTKNEIAEGLGGELRYFKTDFVDAKLTDKNKKILTEKATDMLCIKEDTYEEVKTKNKHFRIFKRGKKYTGIIYDYMEIDAFKEFIKRSDGKFSVYIFSLGDDTFDEEFEDLGNKVKLSPIPEAIMRVYRRVFK